MSALLAILAGGDGKRMGGGKPLAVLGGMTLLDRALHWAATQGLPVVLSVRAEGQFPVPPGMALAIDRARINGPLAGVLGALDHAAARGCRGVITVPVDAPWLPPDLAEKLQQHGDERATVAVSAGVWHPVCAYWPIKDLPRLSAYAAGERQSLRGALQAIEAVAVAWPVTGRDPFAGVNDPGALAAAQAEFQSGR